MVNTIIELSEDAPEIARVAHETARQARDLFRSALVARVASGSCPSGQADEDGAGALGVVRLGQRL